MITQNLMDFFTLWVAGIVSLIPPMPDWVQTALGWITAGGQYVANHIAVLGSVIPFSVISACLTAWGGAMLFWLAMLGFRLILWVVGR